MVLKVFNQEQKAWTEGKVAEMLLMDVKGAFDQVSRNCLQHSMEGMRVDGDLLS